MTPAAYMEAARVRPHVRPQTFGPWAIERHAAPASALLDVGWPDYTVLCRQTMATLHLDHGEVVMDDSRRELRRHLPIWLMARGRVLVTGLGLGCVVRGLLASPAVEHVDVVEIDAGILDVIGPEFYGNPRVSLHHGDALTVQWDRGTRWDFAWHDLWAEGGLQALHARVLVHYQDRCGRQGAWGFPRFAKRRFPRVIG